jgi:hypothetical protein
MVVEGDAAMGVLNHQVVDLIDTTFEGLYQSTPSDDSIKGHRDISLMQFVEHQLPAEVLLFDDIVETSQFLWGMHDIADKYRGLVLEDCHLGGSGAWINHENLHDLRFYIAASAKE